MRAKTQRLRFSILSRVFRFRYFVGQERANTGILLSILWLTVHQFFLAIGVAIFLQVIELVAVPWLILHWRTPDAASYVSWLGVIAQIGGVFIALYFTAVTAAAGAIYAQVPNNIRDLLVRERVGNVYIRYLTLATFLPLCLIALQLVGFEPLRIAVPLMVLVSGVGIVAFAGLGQRAFNLFDPTKLAGSLLNDFGIWLAQVSAGGFAWRDPSFQSHAHRQASAVAETLQTLADLAATHANLDSAPLLEFSLSVLSLLMEYQRRKLLIPTDSLWFEQKYEHKKWYETDDSAVQIAHHAGVSLNPTAVPTYEWVENRLQPIALKCFRLNVKRRRLDNVRDVVAGMDGYVAALTGNCDVRTAIKMAEEVQRAYEEGFSDKEGDTGQAEQAEEAGMADAVCLLQLRVLVTYRAALEQRTPAITKSRIEHIQWKDPKALYAEAFVVDELRQLEWLLPRLMMELDVEGVILTPIWYEQDLVCKAQSEALNENVSAIIEGGKKFFEDWIGRLLKAKRVWQSAAVLSRYLEYVNKLERHLPFFRSHADSLKATRHLTDLPWPNLNPDVWFKTAATCRERLIEKIANHIALLAASPKPEGVPDYLGQFIHETGENLLTSLLNRQAHETKALIRPLLAGTFVLFERMKPSAPTADIWAEQKLQIAAAPVIDLLELSGYGRLFSELYGDEQLWTAVSGIWDALLENSPGTLAWLAAIVTGGTPRFQLPHRGLVRTN